MGIGIVKYVWVWVSAPLCSCVVLYREMTLLVSVYSAAGGRGYKVTLLLQNRQDMLLELHLVGMETCAGLGTPEDVPGGLCTSDCGTG